VYKTNIDIFQLIANVVQLVTPITRHLMENGYISWDRASSY